MGRKLLEKPWRNPLLRLRGRPRLLDLLLGTPWGHRPSPSSSSSSRGGSKSGTRRVEELGLGWGCFLKSVVLFVGACELNCSCRILETGQAAVPAAALPGVLPQREPHRHRRAEDVGERSRDKGRLSQMFPASINGLCCCCPGFYFASHSTSCCLRGNPTASPSNFLAVVDTVEGRKALVWILATAMGLWQSSNAPDAPNCVVQLICFSTS